MRLVAASALILLATPALASAQDNPAPPTAEAKPAKEKKICKLEEAGSTSRMRKRVCRTVKEWDESREDAANGSDLQRVRSR
ncbi:hypothetical protein [Sphingosinicella sp. BN140058]|uniref:hypothetical protein n=1 Tax=Sphingosinicella sp. BN140058 TaxID=1892855 RepID=UPI0010128FE9|nr:hypothetical protein [Sphingosinicella sp. BN140058]QAY76638.1 hypothetical protein ETR14_09100 [Sphingosinicella sp. BN140058]